MLTASHGIDSNASRSGTEVVMRLLIVTAVLVLAVLAAPSSVAACEAYTFDDDQFGLERGVQWAFEGHVLTADLNAETGQPTSVTIRVDSTLRGDPAQPDMTILQDNGCDGFWYRKGDDVVVAVPYQPGLAAMPSARTRLRPPFERVTNYQVAVWVLDGDRVVTGLGPHSWPEIEGRHPRSRSELRIALARLPDTSAVGTVSTNSRSITVALAGAVGLAFSAWVLGRRPGLSIRRRRSNTTPRSS
jgi:hypothetical protein